MPPRPVHKSIPELELTLAQQKAVFTQFPDATYHYYNGFQSKAVNKAYTKYEFKRMDWGIWVMPYCEVELALGDKTELIKVYSSPRQSRLVYLGWEYKTKSHIIKFSRIVFNFKHNNFREDMLNACRAEMMGFIKNKPGLKMDDKHLEPRLKKLLVFT
jgi:hypothetical protein